MIHSSETMLIEVCTFSLESCQTAQRAGASRVELCGGMAEGGTTPSAGLIQLARQHLSIPIHVMIRPRGGDFCYSETELTVMKADIEVARSLGVDGLVFGLLNADGTVNETQTKELVDLANPLPITFHRAFDMTRDPLEALEAVIRTGASCILTSGQHQSAEQGLVVLRQLTEKAAGRISIMAGAGVNAQNASQLVAAGVDILHLSGGQKEDSRMVYRQPGVSMASSPTGEYEYMEANEDKITALRRSILRQTA